jgi:hypothetical protein
VAGPLRPATLTGSPQTAKMALFDTANDRQNDFHDAQTLFGHFLPGEGRIMSCLIDFSFASFEKSD